MYVINIYLVSAPLRAFSGALMNCSKWMSLSTPAKQMRFDQFFWAVTVRTDCGAYRCGQHSWWRYYSLYCGIFGDLLFKQSIWNISSQTAGMPFWIIMILSVVHSPSKQFYIFLYFWSVGICIFVIFPGNLYFQSFQSVLI